MKKLADGSEVSARSYYYLLDWNEQNEWHFIKTQFGKSKLCDLNRVEYKRLFNKATIDEINRL